jgi:putative transposase
LRQSFGQRKHYASIPLCCLHSSRVLHKESPAVSEGQRDAARLHAQLGGISKTLDCAPIITGGMEDHVHLLGRFGRTITQAEWIKELKRVSNLWLKKEYALSDFEWQRGYADFSVSQSNLQQVKRYIANQEVHHRKISFQDEVRALLQRHHMEWDERYIWE